MPYKEFIREFNVTLEELYYEHDYERTHATRTHSLTPPLVPTTKC